MALIPAGKHHLSRVTNRQVPKAALQLVYNMACEMSHSNDYMIGVDIPPISGPKGKDGTHGRQEECFATPNPKVIEALRQVRLFFNLRGTP
jgi:hypothetical protein